MVKSVAAKNHKLYSRTMRNIVGALITRPLAWAATVSRMLQTRMTASERKALLAAAALLLLGASVRFYRHQCAHAIEPHTEKNLPRHHE